MQTKTFNISFPASLLNQVDAQAKHDFKSRSEFFKAAALNYLRTKNNWQILQSDLSLRAKKLGITSEDDIEATIDSLRD